MDLRNKPATQAAAAVAAYEGAQKVFESSKAFWRNHFAFTVTVSERDALYMDIHEWLLSITPDERHRALRVGSAHTSGDYETPESGSEEKAKPLTIKFDDKSARRVIIDGHRITVTIRNVEVASDRNQYREPEAARMEFVSSTYAGQQAVIAHLNRLNDERSSSRKAVLRMVGQWGSWKTRSDLPPRTMSSVSLPEDQKKRIVDDLAFFLASEEKYNRLAIPWHRGYMLHGPPGTGKTSLVKALANHFNLDLWYVSLSDLKAESSLLGLLAEVGPRSILLLEDIDTMRITHDRDGSEQGTISMSSLLNTLDGVATPHGLVTMMTTNRFEVLDDALTRAGRMDLIELLDYPSKKTLVDLFKHFYGCEPNWAHKNDTDPIPDLSTAKVAEIFKRYMTSPVDAEEKIAALMRVADRASL